MRKYSEENAKIGERIRQIRQATHLTQEQFAEQIGVTSAFVSELERGVVGISVSTIRRICQVFGVSCDSIINNTGEPTNVTSIATKLQHLTSQQIELVENMIDLMLRFMASTHQT